MIREPSSESWPMLRAILVRTLVAALPLTALALALPPRAIAAISSVCIPTSNSTAPDCIRLVTRSGSTPATAFGQFTVVVRDLANNPCAGAVVVIDLSLCPDLQLATDQLDPDVTVDCVNKRVTKVAQADGSAVFTVLGGSNGAGNAVELQNAGRIFGNGTLLRAPTVLAFDLDGMNGLGASDLSVFLGDFATGQPYGRVDYDCNGSPGAGDLSVWLGAFASGTMIESCSASCP